MIAQLAEVARGMGLGAPLLLSMLRSEEEALAERWSALPRGKEKIT